MKLFPFPIQSIVLSPELHRAMEYKVSRKLTDSEAIGVIRLEWEELLKNWEKLGRWVITIDNWYPKSKPYKVLSGKPVNNPPLEVRERLARQSREAWKIRKSNRPFGKPSTWRTPEQKEKHSLALKKSWERRKAEAKVKEA